MIIASPTTGRDGAGMMFDNPYIGSVPPLAGMVQGWCRDGAGMVFDNPYIGCPTTGRDGAGMVFDHPYTPNSNSSKESLYISTPQKSF